MPTSEPDVEEAPIIGQFPRQRPAVKHEKLLAQERVEAVGVLAHALHRRLQPTVQPAFGEQFFGPGGLPSVLRTIALIGIDTKPELFELSEAQLAAGRQARRAPVA